MSIHIMTIRLEMARRGVELVGSVSDLSNARTTSTPCLKKFTNTDNKKGLLRAFLLGGLEWSYTEPNIQTS